MTTIHTKRQADSAVKALEKWLAAVPDVKAFGYSEGERADIARAYATQLLTAARCDGLGGCLLCQG